MAAHIALYLIGLYALAIGCHFGRAMWRSFWLIGAEMQAMKTDREAPPK